MDRRGDPAVPSPILPRREVLSAAVSLATATALAGCGSVTDYRFSAPPVVLPKDVRDRLGYREAARKPVTVERSRTIGGRDVSVTVENRIAVYGREGTEGGSAAAPTIGVVSTPTASVLGRSFNPLANRSLPNLLSDRRGVRFLNRVGLGDVGHSRSRFRWERGPTFVGGREGTCLGTATRLERYAGILAGDPPSVAFVHLTRVRADSVVIAAAVHGHDVEATSRAFVGPDAGYLAPEEIGAAVEVFRKASAGFQYASGN